MSKQLNHAEFKAQQKQFKPKIIIVLENLEHDENIGSAFRLADAFNIEKILIVTNKDVDEKKIEKTARNCSKTVPYQILPTIENAISMLEENNYTPISIEICDDSKPLRECDFSKFTSIALIVGNEKYGVSQYALDKSKLRTHIEMYGNNSSLNVSTALAITLYKASEDYLKKKEINKQITL